MTPKERAQLRQQLSEEIHLLAKELSSLEEQLQPIAPECALGDLLRSEMMCHQEVLHRAFVEAKKRYNHLLHAQKRIEDDSYGLCIECDEAIAIERLIAVPEAQQCIDCATGKR